MKILVQICAREKSFVMVKTEIGFQIWKIIMSHYNFHLVYLYILLLFTLYIILGTAISVKTLIIEIFCQPFRIQTTKYSTNIFVSPPSLGWVSQNIFIQKSVICIWRLFWINCTIFRKACYKSKKVLQRNQHSNISRKFSNFFNTEG